MSKAPEPVAIRLFRAALDKQVHLIGFVRGLASRQSAASARRALGAIFLAAALALIGAAAKADEGMWTFDNFPAAKAAAATGVEIDRAWLDRVRGASLRLTSGCSASVVSAEGLVFTNHHCVSDCVQDLSSPKHDLIQNGVVTINRREEKTCPGLQADQLETITDVTAAVMDAVSGKTGEAYVRARGSAVAVIESAACSARRQTHLCEVVSLYQGGKYSLYVYRRYSDVRLVFAPEAATAFFGGDPDNFNFPRYDADFAFLRLYDHGAPVATPGHLRWTSAPPVAGEAVFTSGNPGATNRLMTADQLRSLRDIALPQTIMQFSELRGRLLQFSSQSPENARIANRELFGIENSLKVYAGQLKALGPTGLLDAKRADDADLKRRIAADPTLAASIGDPWGDLAKIQADRAALNARYSLLEQRGGYYSPLFLYARTLVRGAYERPKPSNERMSEFTDAKLPAQIKTLLDAKPNAPALDALELSFWLSKVREYLGADAPETLALLGKESPEALAAKLARSRLGDLGYRRLLWNGGLTAVLASDDPMIQFVLATDALARSARREFDDKVTGPSASATEKIAAARFAVFGTSVYPDATFSPRLSYGKVAGWKYQGETVGPFTTFAGLWARATAAAPFALAPSWRTARQRLDDATVFDIATTNDIVGGNSGSPLLNAKAEVIGAVFDGNIHSLGGAFAYDPTLNRTVAISTAAATAALKAVYGRDALVAELLAP